MRFILNMAGGENLTDNTGYVFDSIETTPHHELQMTLHAPQARLATREIAATGTSTSLAGRDLEALIRSIED